MEATLAATSKQSLSTTRFSHTLFLGILMYIAQFVRKRTITICISTKYLCIFHLLKSKDIILLTKVYK